MIEDKINKLVDHVIKPNPEMDGMPMCPFARAGIDRGEVDFVKQGKDTLIFAEQYIKDFPTGKTLVLCVTDSTDFTQQQLEDFCSKWQPTAIEKNLYLYPSHPDDAAGHLAGLTHGNPGLAMILIQTLSDLNQKAKWLHNKTNYYSYWNQDYYNRIVGERLKHDKNDTESNRD
jgi:hypothetical protein